jgi:hypothetical protein
MKEPTVGDSPSAVQRLVPMLRELLAKRRLSKRSCTFRTSPRQWLTPGEIRVPLTGRDFLGWLSRELTCNGHRGTTSEVL